MEKRAFVDQVFNSVANKYELMNDLMSFGIHRLWKKYTINSTHINNNHNILDLSSGTGDLAKLIYPKMSDNNHLILLDPSLAMLKQAKENMLNLGFLKNISYCLGYAEKIPFKSNSIDLIISSFGLRNFSNRLIAFKEIHRVLKDNGKLFILEFSQLEDDFLKTPYKLYLNYYIPLLGKIITKDQESYEYLANSIQNHPDADIIKQEILASNFIDCDYKKLCRGIVALHKATK